MISLIHEFMEHFDSSDSFESKCSHKFHIWKAFLHDVLMKCPYEVKLTLLFEMRSTNFTFNMCFQEILHIIILWFRKSIVTSDIKKEQQERRC